MTQEAVSISQEQLTLVRQSLFNSVHEKYVAFINAIKNLPIQQVAFHQAFIELDTGILWTKEAVFYGQLMQPEQSTEITMPANEVLENMVTPDLEEVDAA